LFADTLQLSAYTAQESRLAHRRTPSKPGKTQNGRPESARRFPRQSLYALLKSATGPIASRSLERCFPLPLSPAMIWSSSPICLDRGGRKNRRFFQGLMFAS